MLRSDWHQRLKRLEDTLSLTKGIEFDMLSAFMEGKIRSNVNGNLVVTE